MNHSGAVQYEFPVRYTLRRWPGTDKILMLGRDLRPMAEIQQQLVQAHRAIGRDHEAQRELETGLAKAMLLSPSTAPVKNRRRSKSARPGCERIGFTLVHVEKFVGVE